MSHEILKSLFVNRYAAPNKNPDIVPNNPN
jgi:hypothetical protein